MYRPLVEIDLVPWRRLRRVRASVERLQPDPLHQRRDMQPANAHALLPEQIAQHPAAGERDAARRSAGMIVRSLSDTGRGR